MACWLVAGSVYQHDSRYCWVDVKRTIINLCIANTEDSEREEVQDVEEHRSAVVVCVVLQNETGDPDVASEVPRFSLRRRLCRRGRAARASVVFAASAMIVIAAAVQSSTLCWMRVTLVDRRLQY